jgi:hypothetical protein
MTEAETAVRRFYESLSTGGATLVDEVLVPDAKTSRCPAISAHTHNDCYVRPNPPSPGTATADRSDIARVGRSVAYNTESLYPCGPGPRIAPGAGPFRALRRCPWPLGYEPAGPARN